VDLVAKAGIFGLGGRFRKSTLTPFAPKLVERNCPIEINDAKVCRIVSAIVDPSLGGE